jgi:hypothetical protein
VEDTPARLVVTRGPNIDEAYPLTQTETTLGRSAGNTIVLAAPEVSRRHAVIFFRGDQHFLEDLGSTNGTFLNGRRLSERVVLADGDKIQFGDSILMQYRGPAAPTQVVIPASAVQEVVLPPPAAPTAEPPTPAPPLAGDDFIVEPEPVDTSQRRWIIGCGCFPFLAMGLCLAALLALDAYQQGRLLYCGPLRPLFETLLGPFGFNPVCATAF